MPDRITPTPRSELPAAQQHGYDEAEAISSEFFGKSGDPFVWKDPSNGAFLGPFAPLMPTPDLVRPFVIMLKYLADIPGFSKAAREVAILAIGAHFGSKYELYAHERVALAKTSLTRAQVDALVAGKKPQGLDADCDVTYDVACALAAGKGSLDQASWDRAVATLGREGTMALVHYVGYYAYVCIMLNAVDAGVPKDE